MMYVLLFMLLIEIMFIYVCNGHNVVSPSFISCAMFILSTVVFILGKEYFQYKLDIVTVITILLFIFCILIGEYMSNRNEINCEQRTIYFQYIYIQKNVCILMAFVVLLFGVLYYREVYVFSLKVGNITGNFATMAMYVRNAKSYTKSMLVSQGTLLSECIVYFCIYCFFNNLNCGHKDKRFIIPIIAFLPHIMAADNRTIFLKLLSISCIIIFVMMKKKTAWGKQSNKKIILIAIVAISVFLIVFRLLGYRTETSIRNSLWDNLMEYISASLIGLDKFLLNGEQSNTLIGQWTLAGIYNILRQWGVDIPKVNKFEEFYYYGAHFDSNIYTAFKAYIKDYTYIVAILAMVLWGYFIQKKTNKVKKGEDSFFNICTLGLMFYPIAMISIEDVTSAVICMQTVYMLVYLKLIEYFFIRRGIGIGKENSSYERSKKENSEL